MAFDFSSLDLSKAKLTGQTLKPGKYIATIAKAEVKDNKAGNGKNLHLQFRCPEGLISTIIVVAHHNKQAVEIGLDKLYTMLVCCGHPDPRHPNTVFSFLDRKVGIVVTQDGEYTRVSNFYTPVGVEQPNKDNPTLDDDEDPIPF